MWPVVHGLILANCCICTWRAESKRGLVTRVHLSIPRETNRSADAQNLDPTSAHGADLRAHRFTRHFSRPAWTLMPTIKQHHSPDRHLVSEIILLQTQARTGSSQSTGLSDRDLGAFNSLRVIVIFIEDPNADHQLNNRISQESCPGRLYCRSWWLSSCLVVSRLPPSLARNTTRERLGAQKRDQASSPSW